MRQGRLLIPSGQSARAAPSAFRRAGRFVAAAIGLFAVPFAAQADPRWSEISRDGWAKTSVNTSIFRRSSVISQDGHQFAAFYDSSARVIIAHRSLGTDDWTLTTTPFTGNVRDAHMSISLGLDGAGYLHVAWNQHATPLNYARSVAPYSTVLGEPMAMLGDLEDEVTYPEFHQLPGGDMLFLYRDGVSGRGNLVLNRYHTSERRWSRVQANVLDGEGARNAYWQTAIGRDGAVHLSWLWRETSRVETNHDIGYAKSDDGGVSWHTVSGTPLALPITLASTDYAWRVPEGHELINQTSMAVDDLGQPYIATYFRMGDQDVPQFYVIHHDGTAWACVQVTARTTPFRLAGQGTKRIPVSRPQIVVGRGPTPAVHMIFRDSERGGRPSVATTRQIGAQPWTVVDLATSSVGQWEPSFDPALWQSLGRLDLFVQATEQIDAEGVASDQPPTPVGILEWTP